MNKLNTKDRNSLKEAIDLQKEDYNEKALSILNGLIKQNPDSPKVISFLGLILAKTEDYKKAIFYLEKATELNPNTELLFLSLYISYTEEQEYERAFNTLFDYLEKHPANLFKDTLEELLEGLKDSYGSTYKDKIIFYAKKNCITIPDKLEM